MQDENSKTSHGDHRPMIDRYSGARIWGEEGQGISDVPPRRAGVVEIDREALRLVVNARRGEEIEHVEYDGARAVLRVVLRDGFLPTIPPGGEAPIIDHLYRA